MALKIYLDFAASPDVLKLLKDGTSGHHLIVSKKPATSVLFKADWDPHLETVDIYFGQPDPEWIDRFKELKWIQISTSSITRYDNSPFRAKMSERNIAVCNSASVYSEACAVHTLSFILAQTRQLPAALGTYTDIGSDIWYNLRYSCDTLRNQTILILGFGTIGRRLAELLQPLHTHIIAYRRKVKGDEGVKVITGDQLGTVLPEADHIINILPESSETDHFFNAERFSTVKSGAVFYNIGRGTTIDQGALLSALQSGQLKAAWLDVTDPEPLPEDHPLVLQPNCFITPHVAGGHFKETQTLVQHFLSNFKRFVHSEPLKDRVM